MPRLDNINNRLKKLKSIFNPITDKRRSEPNLMVVYSRTVATNAPIKPWKIPSKIKGALINALVAPTNWNDFIKINELEYNKNHELLSDKGFEEKLIVTLGSKGCRYNGKEFSVKEVPVKDVSGAGDTFIAGLVRGYLDTGSIDDAIEFAQRCTTSVVQKHGVSTVSLEELKTNE